MISIPPSIRDSSSTRSAEPSARTFVRLELAVGELDYPIVPLSLARDLRQMGDADDLPAVPELAQLASDDLCNAAADAGVDLVEDEGRDGEAPDSDDLDSKADARQLAARSDSLERAERLTRVEPHFEHDALEAGRVRTLFGLLRELDAKLAVRHAELRELLGHRAPELAALFLRAAESWVARSK